MAKTGLNLLQVKHVIYHPKHRGRFEKIQRGDRTCYQLKGYGTVPQQGGH